MAYVEAMAAGVPAIGCRGEPGPEEIAAAGDGFLLVPPGDIERLTQRIDKLLSDPRRLRETGQRAHATVAANSRGSAAASRPWPPTGTCSVEAAAVRHRTRTRLQGGCVRAPARARADRAGAVGGAAKHGGADFAGELPFPHRHVRPRELFALAASGRYRAVVCPTGGRFAPLAAWAGARRGGIPVILWASLWAHPRSAAHALTYLPLRRLYRSADAVVTYGPHVSAYVSVTERATSTWRPSPSTTTSGAPPALLPPTDPRWPADAYVRFLSSAALPRRRAYRYSWPPGRRQGWAPRTPR